MISDVFMGLFLLVAGDWLKVGAWCQKGSRFCGGSLAGLTMLDRDDWRKFHRRDVRDANRGRHCLRRHSAEQEFSHLSMGFLAENHPFFGRMAFDKR